MDVWRDASASPSQEFRLICLDHGLVGASDSAPVADMSGMTLRAQAEERLMAKHAEFGS